MQSSLVSEDLSNGAEAFKLRVVNQYNDDEEVTPPGFEYITAVEKKEVPMAMSPKSGEGEQQPKLGPYKVCTCKSTCTNACHYDESNNMLRACKAQCACNSQAGSCTVARFTRPTTRFQVFYTPNKGWSLQTLEDIKPGQALFEYVGVLSVDQDQKPDDDDYILAFRCGSHRYLLDAHSKGNLARFVNHSCRPNCCPMLVEATAGGIPRVLVYSLRKIYMGEELVMDYGEDWWLAKADMVRGCCCGSEECKYGKDWCDYIVENKGKMKGRLLQMASKWCGGQPSQARLRQTARKCVGGVRPDFKPRPAVARMEPKELADLLMGEDEDEDTEEEEAVCEEVEPPPGKKAKEANGTAAADGNIN